MDLIGYFAALLIGISLGLIGGGGSILTVPVLVYLFKIDTVSATAYSLFIVGVTSLVGVIPKYRQGLVDTKTAFVFGIPSILGVFFTRRFIVPWIPDEVFKLGSYVVSKDLLLLMLFAILMIAASYSMIRNTKPVKEEVDADRKFNFPLIIIEGLLVGMLTGLVGAGGGFLIIPALIFLSKLQMRKAVGTSLLIIGAKSLIGFTGDVSNLAINWSFLLSITGIAIAGIIAGNLLSSRINQGTLRKAFGWFVLVMGIYIMVFELFVR